jgi:hypothetical protein
MGDRRALVRPIRDGDGSRNDFTHLEEIFAVTGNVPTAALLIE